MHIRLNTLVWYQTFSSLTTELIVIDCCLRALELCLLPSNCPERLSPYRLDRLNYCKRSGYLGLWAPRQGKTPQKASRGKLCIAPMLSLCLTVTSSPRLQCNPCTDSMYDPCLNVKAELVVTLASGCRFGFFGLIVSQHSSSRCCLARFRPATLPPYGTG